MASSARTLILLVLRYFETFFVEDATHAELEIPESRMAVQLLPVPPNIKKATIF